MGLTLLVKGQKKTHVIVTSEYCYCISYEDGLLKSHSPQG